MPHSACASHRPNQTTTPAHVEESMTTMPTCAHARSPRPPPNAHPWDAAWDRGLTTRHGERAALKRRLYWAIPPPNLVPGCGVSDHVTPHPDEESLTTSLTSNATAPDALVGNPQGCTSRRCEVAGRVGRRPPLTRSIYFPHVLLGQGAPQASPHRPSPRRIRRRTSLRSSEELLSKVLAASFFFGPFLLSPRPSSSPGDPLGRRLSLLRSA